ncbi:adenylyltransferase/cytidyltransferase family protein, partial [bacterium]|nr:adenylyltransferase/cytidyltransferase family protein [bacterium]
MSRAKVVTVDSLREGAFAGRRVGACHGHFNVLHPGHRRFLQHARSQCDVLVVGILGPPFIPEELRPRYFPIEERALGVAALDAVEKVVLIETHDALIQFARLLAPAVYVLGTEFEEERRREVDDLLRALEAQGALVQFHSGEVRYASTELLYTPPRDIELERLRTFRAACARQRVDLRQVLARLRSLAPRRLLVIGDTIVDQYVACDAVGMSAEAPVLVVRELEARDYIGGAAVVAAHVRALGADCQFISVVGNDSPAAFVKGDLERRGIDVHLIEDRSRPTTFKIRYMVDNQKLFRVSRLSSHSIARPLEAAVVDALESHAQRIDGVVVSDFVHGVITSRVLGAIQALAARNGVRTFGDLQCSSQVGNVAKLVGFDLLCPTEREARLALGNHEDGVEHVAQTLLDRASAKNLVLKLGANGFISYERTSVGTMSQHFPALSSNPLDVTGAGDSLLAAMSLALASGFTMMEASALGACMAALAVNR